MKHLLLTLISFLFLIPVFSQGTLPFDHLAFANHFVKVLQKDDSVTFQKEFFTTKEKMVESVTIVLNDKIAAEELYYGGLDDVEGIYDRRKMRFEQVLIEDWGKVQSWKKENSIELSKLKVKHVSFQSGVTASVMVSKDVQIFVSHKGKYYSIKINAPVLTSTGWSFQNIGYITGISASKVEPKYVAKPVSSKPELLPEYMTGFAELYEKNDSVAFCKTFSLSTKEEDLLLKTFEEHFYFDARGEEKEKEMLKAVGDKVKDELKDNAADTYTDMKEWLGDKPVSSSKIKVVDYFIQLNVDKKFPVVLSRGFIIVEKDKTKYKIKFKEAFWFNDQWYGGKIRSIKSIN